MPERAPAERHDPPHSGGYGPAEHADDTRQAQQTVSNDAPTDVNINAVICRSQSLTFDGLGKGFASNQDRRDKMFDALAYKGPG